MTKTKHSLQSPQWWSPSFQEETSTSEKTVHQYDSCLLPCETPCSPLIDGWLSWKTWKKKIHVFTTASPRIWSRIPPSFQICSVDYWKCDFKNILTFISLQREMKWPSLRESEKDKLIYPSLLGINYFPFFSSEGEELFLLVKIPFLFI